MKDYRTVKLRTSTYQTLKVLAAQRGIPMMELVDRIVRGERSAATYREQRLIAHIQALIAVHRYPAMYNVSGVLADAEAAWQIANVEILSESPNDSQKDSHTPIATKAKR